MITPRSVHVPFQTLAVGAALLSLCGVSHAYLGGFETQDGYQPFLNRCPVSRTLQTETKIETRLR